MPPPFEIAEASYLAEHPEARSESYVPPAPATVPTVAPEPQLTDAELAAAAAFSLTDEGRRMDPHAAAACWSERVRGAQLAEATAGPLAAAPGGLKVAAGVQINEADWKAVNDLAGTVSALTGRRYCDDLGAEGGRIREALFHARAAVMAGQPIDPELLEQVRANIASDQAESDRRKAAKDAEDPKTLRERQQ